MLTDGCVSYWKLDDNGSGDVSLIDSSGNNHTLTNNYSVALGVGKIAGAGSFSYDPANSLTNTSLVSSDYTISAWIKLTDFAGGVAALGSPDPNGPAIVVAETITYFFYGVSSGSDCNPGIAADPLSVDTWNHVVGVVDSANFTQKWYLNGSLISEDGFGSIDAFGGIEIGAYNARLIPTFNGLVDEVGVWNRPLSPSEVATLYNSGDGLTYPFGSPVPSGKKISLGKLLHLPFPLDAIVDKRPIFGVSSLIKTGFYLNK